MSLARQLAHSSDKAVRDTAFNTLSAWLRAASAAPGVVAGGRGGSKTSLSALDAPTAAPLPVCAELPRVWKALFFSLWHADKVPVQQELIARLAGLARPLRAAGGAAHAARFLDAGLASLAREWPSLDHLRLDKFLSLARRLLGEALRLPPATAAEIVIAPALASGRPSGLRYHLIECFLDELACSAPDADTASLQVLLRPLYVHCIRTDEPHVFATIVSDVLTPLASRTEAAVASAGAPPQPPAHTPLLMDVDERAAAAARAFRCADLAPIARDLFAMAAFASTQGSHRAPLYAAHSAVAAAALRLGHAKDEAATCPTPVGVPTPTVASAFSDACERAVGSKRDRREAGLLPSMLQPAAAPAPARAPAPAPVPALAPTQKRAPAPTPSNAPGPAAAAGRRKLSAEPAPAAPSPAFAQAAVPPKTTRKRAAPSAAADATDAYALDAMATLAALPTAKELAAAKPAKKAEPVIVADDESPSTAKAAKAKAAKAGEGAKAAKTAKAGETAKAAKAGEAGKAVKLSRTRARA